MASQDSVAPGEAASITDNLSNFWPANCDYFLAEGCQYSDYQQLWPPDHPPPAFEVEPAYPGKSSIDMSHSLMATRPTGISGPMNPYLGQQRYTTFPPDMPNQSCYNSDPTPRPIESFDRTTAETFELPIAKRVRVDPQNHDHEHDAALERCYSQTGSQSDCCSSCSDGEPCALPDCEEDEAITCGECADYDTNSQKPVPYGYPEIAAGARTQAWNESQNENAWSSQSPQIAQQAYYHQPGNAANTANPSYGVYPGMQCSAGPSPAPTSPSMVNHMQIPFSPNSTIPTPSMHANHSHQNLYDATPGVLSGAGAIFNSPNAQWSDSCFGSSAHDAAQFSFICTWEACQKAFHGDSDWAAHVHEAHINPQVVYQCPMQQEDCPQNIGPDPLNHMKLAHGFDFTTQDQTFTCPDSSCSSDKVFTNGVSLQNHIGQAHTRPIHGSLMCGMQACHSKFDDTKDIFDHLAHQHMNHDEEIDLSSNRGHIRQDLLPATLPAIHPTLSPTTKPPFSTTLPTNQRKQSSPSLESEEDIHRCKWGTDDGVCNIIFDTAKCLQNHIIDVHLAPLDKKSGYLCSWEGCTRKEKRGQSGAGFSQRGKLERHMATHTNYKCCKCTICDKEFSAQQALVQHMNLHNGEKPYKCKFCDKAFPQQSACTIHERTHSKLKPLSCEICGMAFSESSNLSKHRKTHGEKGAHACSFPGCPKTFHRLDQLKRHKLTHFKAGGHNRGGSVGSDAGVSHGSSEIESES